MSDKPAFPITDACPHHGMTMRQYYKARAPFDQVTFNDMSMFAKYAGVDRVPDDFEGLLRVSSKALARYAGEFADAMLAEDEAHEAGGKE